MTENLFTPDNHLSEDSIYLFIDALKLERTDKLPEAIQEHVEDCQQCKKEIIDLYATVRGITYSDGESHPFLSGQREPGSTLYPYLRMAAVIVILIGAAVFSYFLFTDKEPAIVIEERVPEEIPAVEPGEEIITEEDTLPEKEAVPIVPDQADLFAANFTPIPLYEGLVDQQFRFYGLRVSSPSIGQEVTGEVTFEWDIRYSEPVTLSIINNRLETVYRQSTTENRIRFSEPLYPGIYYWRLDTDDETLYVGKFFVPIPEK